MEVPGTDLAVVILAAGDIEPAEMRRVFNLGIGMALLARTFILIGFVTHMSVNRIRTAPACRHAAWMEGVDRTRNDLLFLSNENIDHWFFFPFPGEDTWLRPVVVLEGQPGTSAKSECCPVSRSQSFNREEAS